MKAMSIIKNIRVKYADKYMRSIDSDKDAYINWLQDEYAELVMKQANEAERSSDKCHIQNVMAMLPDEKEVNDKLNYIKNTEFEDEEKVAKREYGYGFRRCYFWIKYQRGN